MKPGVWVWAEQRKGKLMRVSLELLAKGKELANALGTSVAAVIVGYGVEGLADELAGCGADQVYLVTENEDSLPNNQIYSEVLSNLAKKYSPDILLIGATHLGMDLAPRVAAELDTGLTAHCTDLSIEDVDGVPLLIQQVPGFEGGFMLKIICPQKRPQMATVKPGVFEVHPGDQRKKAEIVPYYLSELTKSEVAVKVLEMVEEKPTTGMLEDAEVIVAGGWGLYGAGGTDCLKELSAELKAEIAGSRPAVDKGWIPESRMIGVSGKTVGPKLFISVGASGATHYVTGFLKSGTILAVDRNPKAQIFEVCDLGIVGNAEDVIPALTGELQKER
jgi:electron transfer flavoprotein alpha subunit